jgi:hypothetical protein
MKTGAVVESNWLYVSECCLLEVYFESGKFFGARDVPVSAIGKWWM